MTAQRPALRVALASSRIDTLEMMRQACAGSGFLPVLAVVPPVLWRERTRETDPATRLAKVRAATPPEMGVLALPAADLPDALRLFGVDMVVVCGYPTLLPPFVVDTLPGGGINCHPSLLPRWQGPSPISWALRMGDPRIGLSVHRMNGDTYDSGPVLAQDTLPSPDDDFDPATLHARAIRRLVRGVLPKALAAVLRGEPGTLQDPNAATWAGFMDHADRYLDRGQSPLTLHHLTRALRYLRWTPHIRIDGAWHTITRTSPTPTPTCNRRVDCANGAPLWVADATPASVNTAHPRIYT
ncbi:formyltransferase family protein [Embleya sp. NPDC050154]|uniref:formyltransferase family protein n=1 Tax=Embleya sp. NPDC050154 TaxID=3363988 RepID=UPI00378E0091